VTRSPRLTSAAAALAAALLAAAPARAEARRPAAPAAAAPARPQDPADSLYRAARALLSDGAYDRAADAFREVAARHPRSRQAPDALYYEAFARYRAGGTRNLRAALAALDAQRQRAADAPGTVSRDDAAALATRIRGVLARAGDADAAAAVATDARAAGASCPTGRGDDDERAAALSALAQLGGDQALGAIQRVLARRDACSAPLRRKAVFLLSQQRAPETADALLRVAQSDPDREVREQAVFWLSQVRSPRATELLVGIVNGSGRRGAQGEGRVRPRPAAERARHAGAPRPRRARRRRRRAAREGDLLARPAARPREHRVPPRALRAPRERRPQGARAVRPLAAAQRGQRRLAARPRESAREPVELRKKAVFWASQAGVSVAQLAGLYGRASDRRCASRWCSPTASAASPRPSTG
jgi:tetratricopeptide (TPR) repeat protein